MSFEDWKKQNLLKAGQSEHIGREPAADRLSQRKQSPNIHAALDTLGDDNEIELDFSGLLPDGPELPAPARIAVSDVPKFEQSDALPSTLPKINSGSKDAGTTCKERFNYASFDCAANVLKTNAEAASAYAVLGENKDSYMLNVCSAENKFIILELCDDISIDTIVLANYEFFSSIFRTFRVSVSDKYPVKTDKWKTLGTFEARNSRDIQAFLVENPVIWARYIRIEFLTHYGKEYYCPVSLVRVHGTTMLEEYKHDLESAQPDHEDENELEHQDASEGEVLVPEAVAEPIKSLSVSMSSAFAKDDLTSSSTSGLQPLSTEEIASKASKSIVTASTEVGTTSNATTSSLTTSSAANVTSSGKMTLSSDVNGNTANGSMPLPGSTVNVSNTTASNVTVHSVSNSTGINANVNTTQAVTERHNASVATNAINNALSNTTASDRQKTSSVVTGTQPQAAAPTMQESFFKSVQKRLQMLESNSSLSLQYIEDQSRALRDAFNKVEQRQLGKTTSFLDHLNTTVLSELREFRQQYDQLWQSTVIELEVQRERYHHETEAMNARLGILADELIYQKRLSILQMILVLICLALVMFSRGNFNQYLELPLVQSVLARSPSSRWLNTVSLDTPTQSPPSTRQNSVRKRVGILKGHRRIQSEDSIDDSLSPNDYAPPTPTSMRYDETNYDEDRPQPVDDPEFDPVEIERPSTSPPELQSNLPPSPDLTDASDHESMDTRLLQATPEKNQIPRLIIEEATPPHKQR